MMTAHVGRPVTVPSAAYFNMITITFPWEDRRAVIAVRREKASP